MLGSNVARFRIFRDCEQRVGSVSSPDREAAVQIDSRLDRQLTSVLRTETSGRLMDAPAEYRMLMGVALNVSSGSFAGLRHWWLMGSLISAAANVGYLEN